MFCLKNLGLTVFFHIGKVTPSSIHYVTKYCLAYSDLPFDGDSPYRPFMLCSRHPAIGSNYLSSAMVNWHRASTPRTYVVNNGFKLSMPKYYRDRIWSKEERFFIRLDTASYVSRKEREYIRDFGSYDDVSPVSMKSQRKFDYLKRYEKQKKFSKRKERF